MSARKAGLQSVSVGLCCLLVLSACPMAGAQEAAPAPKLVITILDGEGALNDIRARTAREPIVEVQDENHKPIAGAAVLFSLPSSGPGGAFANGAQTLSTLTDAAGRAAATGLRPNGVQGSYDIHVTVNYQGASAETTIHQRNVSGQSSSTTTTEQVAHGISMKAVLIIVGTAAAAGTVGAILATRGGNSTTITPGTPTVGAPTVVGGSLTIPLHGRHH